MGATPGLELHQAEAVAFLGQDREGFDSVYSVYGAAWFTDPARLLPAVRERLRPGGRLVFSQRPAVEGCYGCQASYIPRGDDEDPLVVKRWDYEADGWERLLRGYGFTGVDARVLAAPPGNRTIGTLIVQARA
ncbi:methyltransferase domain-containing protein [Streptomyces sp. NPDC048291]|uniref:methyltransferase domain-containing protein n=1 Tax=Streptomyces sp. NPDC048291 TaxID=3365530 RepID=UPI003721F476